MLATQGYAIVRGVLSRAEVEALREEAERLQAGRPTPCLRFLEAKSAAVRSFAASESIGRLLPQGMTLVRSMLFDKSAQYNWPVAWHQDLTICVAERHEVPGYGPWTTKEGLAHVQPPDSLLQRMLAVRVHLDDAPASNGALRLIPGSHRAGKCTSEQVQRLTRGAPHIAECLAGDVLLMRPLVLHSSPRAREPRRRRVVHLEFARSADLAPPLRWLSQSAAAL